MRNGKQNEIVLTKNDYNEPRMIWDAGNGNGINTNLLTDRKF